MNFLNQKKDPLVEELRRIDVIDAINGKAEKEAYWRTLHPIVQSLYLWQVGWEHEKELPFPSDDARSVFDHWGNNCCLTPDQEALLERYTPEKELLRQQAQEADRQLKAMDAEVAQKRKQAWEAYWEHYQTLPRPVQSRVLWELAKRRPSQGRSGFHWGDDTQPGFPFAVCGWATYPDPRWKYGDAWGVAFRINRECFGDREPLLYYLDDDNWPWELLDLELMRRHSSGIVDIRTEHRRCVGWDGHEAERQVVLFRLDPAAVKQTVSLSEHPVPTGEVGEYILVLPRAGEFYCLLGEVLDGEMIPLHKDDFCMK